MIHSLIIHINVSTNLSYTSIFITLLSLYKPTETVFSLSISILSTSDSNPVKSGFVAKLDVSTPVAHFKSVFVA